MKICRGKEEKKEGIGGEESKKRREGRYAPFASIRVDRPRGSPAPAPAPASASAPLVVKPSW